MTGAEAVIKCLLQEKVKIVFGYPGGAILPIYDALYEAKNQLRHILVRHEQAAAHAAEGYARLTNKPGVCFATSGPGATNLLTGLADAMGDSIPLICITGQVANKSLGKDAFQEVDIISMSIPVTKWSHQITQAKKSPIFLLKLFIWLNQGDQAPFY